MSLDYDYRNCTEAAKAVIENDEGTTQSIVFGLLFVQIGVIEEKNIDELEWRSLFYRQLDWGWCATDHTVPTRDEWAMFIGLRCNVMTETRSQFVRNQIKRLQQDVSEIQRKLHQKEAA